MRNKFSMLGIVLLTFITMSSGLVLLCETLNGEPHGSAVSKSSQAIDRASAEFKGALKAVREAEAAGADEERIAILVDRLNSVLRMMDESKRLLLKGNITEAEAIAEQTIDTSRRIVSEAIELHDKASFAAYWYKIFTFGMAPVASLLVTVGAHYGWKWWRKHEVDRIMRMETKKIKEPKED